ncbi:unnamed protein product [Lupinus luteus]|uniref:Uncharacterized protein n=1 Tax=Lupinus luteus TaxID=3873 RepID=A0AAV1XX13_LUPLU
MPVCWSELDDRAEGILNPSSPHSPFPKMNRMGSDTFFLLNVCLSCIGKIEKIS